MNKIQVVRVAQTVPVLNNELNTNITGEQFLNNIVGITFKKTINKGENVVSQIMQDTSDKSLLINCLDQGHGSVLEHMYITYAVINASRSFLAQQTRHRLMSYTSSSQHYIDHTEMSDAEIPVELIELNNPEILDIYLQGYNSAKDTYDKLVNEYHIDHSVARQLLPNAQRNTLLITANVREWINYMNQRLCNRNTSEIKYIAYMIKKDLETILPTCAEYMVPDCIKFGKCTQKKMACGKKWSTAALDEEFKVLLNKEEIKDAV